MREVRAAIHNLKKLKSPGCDDVPAELIHAGGEASVRIYHALCVQIWNSNEWLNAWERSIYISIPKTGTLKLCSNFRTIALLSHISKILLRIITKIKKKRSYDDNHDGNNNDADDDDNADDNQDDEDVAPANYLSEV